MRNHGSQKKIDSEEAQISQMVNKLLILKWDEVFILIIYSNNVQKCH